MADQAREFIPLNIAVLTVSDTRALAATRMLQLVATAERTGSHRWNGGIERFNLGLFRGIAGVGYAALRQIDGSLPNVLVWE